MRSLLLLLARSAGRAGGVEQPAHLRQQLSHRGGVQPGSWRRAAHQHLRPARTAAAPGPIRSPRNGRSWGASPAELHRPVLSDVRQRHRARRHPAQLPLSARGRRRRRAARRPRAQRCSFPRATSAAAGARAAWASRPISRSAFGRAPWLALHANAGLPDARREEPGRRDRHDRQHQPRRQRHLAAAPNFNLMLELCGSASREWSAPVDTPRRTRVPQSGGPMGLQLRQRSPDRARRGVHARPHDAAGKNGLFLYLSFEHPFRH